MYLLCAKSPQGPPIAPGQSPLFKTKIDEMSQETKILSLRTKVAELLQMELNSFNLLYCGRKLDDEKTVGHYGIKATSSVHVIPKAPVQVQDEIDETRTVTDDELQQFMIAFGMAIKNPVFNRVAQGLAKRENLESLIAATPSLAKDPIACGFLSKPELLLSLLDPETYKYVYKRHPGIAEAAYQLAATVHEEKPSAQSSSNDADTAAPANPFAYHLDEMSDDDDDDEDMDVGPASGSMSGQRNNTLSAITAGQLAAALANAQNTMGIFGGMTGMMGGGAQSVSAGNPGPSNLSQMSGLGAPNAGNSNASAIPSGSSSIANTPSPRITHDQLAAALAAAASSMTPASVSSQGTGHNPFFTPPATQGNTSTGPTPTFGLPESQSFGSGSTSMDSQIATIREITGIEDMELASRALQVMGGDVQAAVDLILSGWLGADDTAN